jgi:hypothetical protein
VRTVDIDHVGFAVHNAATELERLRNRGLFIPSAGEEDDGLRWVLGKQDLPSAGIRIELLDANDAPASPIARHLEKLGEGAQHITFLVDDLPGIAQRLKNADVDLARLDLEYAPWQETFIRPKDGLGVVIQLASTTHSYDAPDTALKPHRLSGRNPLWWEHLPSWEGSPAKPLALTEVTLEVFDETFADLIFGDVLGGTVQSDPRPGTLYRWGNGALRIVKGHGLISELHLAAANIPVTDKPLRIGHSTLTASR